MANILILGGGFGGVVAAESLAKQLGDGHQLTLISNNRNFTFYPELVRLAFGRCEPAVWAILLGDLSQSIRGK